MNSTTTIGAIPIATYLQAIGHSRRSRKAAFGTIGLLLLTSAGSFGLGTWNGRHTEKLSLAAAVAIAGDDSMPLNRRESALGHVYTIVDTTLTRMREQATPSSPISAAATTYLRNLSAKHFATKK
jgi:hypothetical protein